VCDEGRQELASGNRCYAEHRDNEWELSAAVALYRQEPGTLFSPEGFFLEDIVAFRTEHVQSGRAF
jgi:hypothetical protein